MNKKQNKHINDLINLASSLMKSKYENGVKEHEGNLWESKNILDEAINEALDLLIYLLTIKYQKLWQKKK